MNFSQRISSILQFQRQTSSHRHLLNESQPLHTWQLSKQVELTGARNVDLDGLNDLFQESIRNLGGKENILLVAEARYSPEEYGGSHGVLEDLSSALFQMPKRDNFSKASKSSVDRYNNSMTCIISKSPSKSRILEFPVVLAVFRIRLIINSKNLIKEILRDIQLRTRQFGSAIVGIVYSWETFKDDKNIESKEELRNLMSQVFRDQPWGVCCYNSSEPKSIFEVKRVITESVGAITTDGYQQLGDDNIQVETSFRELVGRLGGKEKFLLLGNICPSARNSERTQVFKEIIRALFEDDDHCNMGNHGDDRMVTAEKQRKSSKECIQLPKPKSFPYPLILVVFRSTFLDEEVNAAQVKEILTDIKSRVTMCSTQVIVVICSEEPLERDKEHSYQILLQKILSQTFSCPTGVCSFVRTNLESVEGVKRCVCNVLKMS